MSWFRVELQDSSGCQATIAALEIDRPIRILRDQDDSLHHLVATIDGEYLGTLPRRGKLPDAISAGGEIVEVRLQCISTPSDRTPIWRVAVQVYVNAATIGAG